MKKRIEKYIPRAIELIHQVKIDKGGVVSNEFKGYFSSFGAAIIQNGLKPALAFFSNEASDAKENRAKILIAIYHLVYEKDYDKTIKANKLLHEIIQLGDNYAQKQEEIIDASIALKLAVRTYKLEKKNG